MDQSKPAPWVLQNALEQLMVIHNNRTIKQRIQQVLVDAFNIAKDKNVWKTLNKDCYRKQIW